MHGNSCYLCGGVDVWKAEAHNPSCKANLQSYLKPTSKFKFRPHISSPAQASLVSVQLQQRCSAVGPQDVANVLCAMARMGFRPSAQWMASVMANVSGVCVDSIEV